MEKEIAYRIQQIRRGEVPEGYRKGPLGIAPDEWGEVLFSTLFTSRSEYTDDLSAYPLYSLTIEEGITPKTERYERSHLVKKENSYKIIRPGEYAYNPMNLRFGAVARHKGNQPVAVSGYYDIFATLNEDDQLFMDNLLNCDAMLTYYNKVSTGSLIEKQRVHFSEFMKFSFPLPPLNERIKIAGILAVQDKEIELQQKKIDETKKLKKVYLEKMFPKHDGNVPEIRFPEFTDPWEQRKFRDTVIIERGGSPRPIEDFITDAEDGLNWVKIGDAPTMGNYITKTKEKIRPEGLAKTREVHPGDLILSNSMSFGKPYIMGINGCIHDGWLLIRNEKKVYDLTFLCHLLGIQQMLAQYKSLAAGSAVNNLNKELVGSTIVSYPTQEEQRAIGGFLSAIDDLITLHQRKLDEMKKLKKTLIRLLMTGIVRVKS